MGGTIAKREELWPHKSKPWENSGSLWFAVKNHSCKYNFLKIMLSFNKHIEESDDIAFRACCKNNIPFHNRKKEPGLDHIEVLMHMVIMFMVWRQ